jgi:hypothetical protein
MVISANTKITATVFMVAFFAREYG